MNFLKSLPLRRRRALRSARVLDEVVDAQLALLPELPDDLRERAADRLAELVGLSQAYRHFSQGWITRRELETRGRAALRRLEGDPLHPDGATHRI
ncbi:hypothetical protein [Saccharopolyspora sp. CA-218241]|uniref:hypothetical protein n=1 Tax=Saccharopolyspora sp. CA-218241 TaxID=3240027 RepID=UPI003D99CC41